MKTPAERKAAERERKLKAGIRQRMFWLTDDQFKKVKAYVARLLRGERK